MKGKILVSSALLAVSNFSINAQERAENTYPNVIYIMADDLGIGDLGCYGQKYIKTPAIDKLASNGMRFAQHYAGCTVSAPSRGSLMTGMHTGHSYVRGNKTVTCSDGEPYDYPLADAQLTVGEIMKNKDYSTACIGKWGLGGPDSEGHPNKQGFDYFYGYLGQLHAHRYYPEFLFENATKIKLNKEVYSHDLIMEKALAYIENNADNPFFLYLTPTIPHADLILPEGELGKYDGMFAEKPYRGGYAAQDKPRATFAAMVSRLDKGVQQIMDLLERKGLLENTIVIFTSDNGTHIEGGHDPFAFDSNSGFRGTKRDLYEGGVRTPFIVHWPAKIRPGAVSYHVSAFWDFLPTLCDLTDQSVPLGIDGISYLPALTGEGEQAKHEYLYWEFHEEGGKQAVLKDNWKLIRLQVNNPEKTRYELYNLNSDPTERLDVSKQYKDKVEELALILNQAHTPNPIYPFKGENNNTSSVVSALSQSIHPTPQEVIATGKTIGIPQAVSSLFGNNTQSKGYQVIVGVKGDKSVKAFAQNIPTQSEGYYLSINEKRVVVAGADERGLQYGLQSLYQLVQSGSLPIIEVKDWPDVAYRGVVEGFYGTPWSFDARLSQIKFYGENKLNTYIYGPKDDPYHSSPHWRSPYPEAEALEIKALVDCAKENNVDFVWAIHPGKDIKWTQDDKDNLILKFENMYNLGVRSFAVFFDDIAGEGTKADKQAELLNYVNRNFIQVKKDVKPLIMCPTEYNKSWSNVEKGYLPTLGKDLDEDIQIMWTGDRVCTDIHRSSLEWINPHIKRPAFIWWNYPVSDYVRDHLLMGRVYGNDLDIANLMSGFVCNPMERAEASKIAIYSVAAYAWNMKKYDADKAWQEAISTLMPNNSKALKKFVEYNSDLGPNGHGYRREESVHIVPTLNSVINSGKISDNDYRTLYAEFTSIVEAATELTASDDNRALLAEIEPWVMQFKNVGETGLAVLNMYKALEEGNKAEFERKYNLTKALNKINFNIDQTYNQNPYQPGVKTASLHVVPFINKVFATTVKQYNEQYNGSLDDKTSYSPFKMETSLAQLKSILLQTKLNKVTIPPVNEIIRWGTDDYIQVESESHYLFSAIRINMEGEDTDWVLEFSADGKLWNAYNEPVKFKTQLKLVEPNIKYLKIINKGVEREIKFNRCEVEFTQ